MYIVNKNDNDMILDLKGSKFSEDDQKNFQNFLEKQNRLKEIILEDTNITKETIKRMTTTIATSLIHRNTVR